MGIFSVGAIGSVSDIGKVISGIDNTSETFIVEYNDDTGEAKYAIVNNSNSFIDEWLWGSEVEVDEKRYSINGKVELSDEVERVLRDSWQYQRTEARQQFLLAKMYRAGRNEESEKLEPSELLGITSQDALLRPDLYLGDEDSLYNFSQHDGDAYLTVMKTRTAGLILIITDLPPYEGESYRFPFRRNGGVLMNPSGEVLGSSRLIMASEVAQLSSEEAVNRLNSGSDKQKLLTNIFGRDLGEAIPEEMKPALRALSQENVERAAWQLLVGLSRQLANSLSEADQSLLDEAQIISFSSPSGKIELAVVNHQIAFRIVTESFSYGFSSQVLGGLNDPRISLAANALKEMVDHGKVMISACSYGLQMKHDAPVISFQVQVIDIALFHQLSDALAEFGKY